MRDRFTETAVELLATDDRSVVVLADIGAGGFTRAAAGGRVVNVGIREQLQIGVAAGLALEGFRPIVHSYAPFLVERPFEQIKLDLGHQDVGAILVSVGASYDAAAEGRTHQAPEDVALLATLPDWTVVVPGHHDEVEVALRRAAVDDGRWYVRLSEDQNGTPHLAGLDGVVTIRSAPDGAPAVLAVGPMLDRVVAATDDLDVAVLYTSRPVPLDRDRLRSAITGDALVVIEPYLAGTSAAVVAAALDDRPMRTLHVGFPRAEHRRYGNRADHDRAHGLDAEGLRRRIRDFLERRSG